MSADNTNVKHRFDELYKKAKSLGLNRQQLSTLHALKEIRSSKKNIFLPILYIGLRILSVLVIIFTIVFFLNWPVKNEKILAIWFNFQGVPDDEIFKEECILQTSDSFADTFRPPIDCSFCHGIEKIPRVRNIVPEEFEEKYAYGGQPVIIMDGMKNWTALKTFSFDFFKDMYKKDSPALENIESNCQFFPYKTTFRNLGDVFNMSEDRARMKDGAEPWYIGWSNCDFSAGNILRQHYDRPYFLPDISESSKTDWIFIGSPGYGAHMHIDNVGLSSWQAQVTGTKVWTLEPPPECYFECHRQMKVTIHPGEIFVLDTNKWYHSTLVIGNEMSICIGSEFD